MKASAAMQTARLSREQAHNLGRYPELLAHMVDMLTTALEQRVADLTGHPDEHIEVLIAAEVHYLTPEETDA